MNALADERVGSYLKDGFVSTYVKVGTFQIVNGQKVGGNVASYFCLPDGSVVHVVPGKVDATTFLNEARFALETHKFASMVSTELASGRKDPHKYQVAIRKAHEERLGQTGNWAMMPGTMAQRNSGRQPYRGMMYDDSSAATT